MEKHQQTLFLACVNVCGVCFVSGGVHDGPAVHAAVITGVGVRGIQAGFGRHQRPGHRAAVASVLHHRLQFVVLRLGHEVVDGERVVEGVVVRVVRGVVVRFQLRGLVQQQRLRLLEMMGLSGFLIFSVFLKDIMHI